MITEHNFREAGIELSKKMTEAIMDALRTCSDQPNVNSKQAWLCMMSALVSSMAIVINSGLPPNAYQDCIESWRKTLEHGLKTLNGSH
jgi:hypothetical protein